MAPKIHLPMINWNLFEVERYMKKPTSNADKNIKPEDMRAMPVITARGCAFKCSFCHYVFWDDPYRNRSPKQIVDEIEHLMKKYDVNCNALKRICFVLKQFQSITKNIVDVYINFLMFILIAFLYSRWVIHIRIKWNYLYLIYISIQRNYWMIWNI